MSVRRKALCFTIVAGVGLGVSACARSAHTVSTQQEKMHGEQLAMAETVQEEVLVTPELPVREQIIHTSSNDISMRLLESGASKTLVIEAPDMTSVETLALHGPTRFVVDLYGQSAKKGEVLTVDDEMVSAIRVGTHPDKTRVVLDLQGDATPSITTEGKEIIVTLAGEQLSVPADGGQSDTVASNTVSSANAMIEPQLPVQDTLAEEVSVKPVAQEMLAKQASTSLIELTGLGFERGWEDSGVVTVSLSEQSAFDLVKSAPSEYVLTLPNATALESTLAPRIAPRGFPGIRAARAVVESDSVKVRMFVDAGVKLNAVPSGNSIKIEASAVVPAKDPRARAQAQMLELEEDTAVDALPVEAAAPPEDGAEEVAAEDIGEDDTARQNPTGVLSTDGSRVYTGRLISLDLQDTDIDNALRIIAEVSNLNIIASDDVSGKVTLRLIDVPWDQALDVILKTNGLDQVVEGNVIRIAPVDKLRQEREALREAKRAQQALEDLKVEYVRVSYARVDDMREQVEAVVSERGTVAVDERTNQLIIKDIQLGQKAARELISRLDLRTPQVLLETQIVEGQRDMLRDLGFQWNYNYIASPGTGNATGYNFPNSVTVQGGTSDDNANPFAVNFPAVLTGAGGSAITAILDSADGSRSLSARMSALETEGRVRVVSRPQVATVNNKQAEIRSVETVRVRVPGSGTSIATGAGAAANGGGASAFEEIDVGIELQVTPQASPDYYVLLDVNARSSAFGATEVDNIPSTIEREATSTILVKSGQTFALGGVYRINDADTISGVPWLKDIPFLGWLFRRSFTNKKDEELIFFITPHIVEGSFDPSIM